MSFKARQDVLMSIEYIRMLAADSQGLESMVYELGKAKFGSVSSACVAAVRSEKQGTPVRTTIEKIVQGKGDSSRKRLFSALISDNAVELDLLVNDLVEEQKRSVDGFLEKLNTFSTWLLFLVLAPIVIVMLQMISDLINDFPEDTKILDLQIAPIFGDMVLACCFVLILVVMFIISLRK